MPPNDLFSRFGKKRYIISNDYFLSLNKYIENKGNSKDFCSRLEKFKNNDLDDIPTFISSLVTHSLIMLNVEKSFSVSDIRTILRFLDELLSGDLSGIDDFRNEFLLNY